MTASDAATINEQLDRTQFFRQAIAEVWGIDRDAVKVEVQLPDGIYFRFCLPKTYDLIAVVEQALSEQAHGIGCKAVARGRPDACDCWLAGVHEALNAARADG